MMISALGAAHVAAALAALLFGLIVASTRKGTQFHRAMGMSYATAMIVLNMAAMGIYRLTGHFGPFHALALASLAGVVFGVGVAIARRPNWLNIHFRAMSLSYLGLLAATVTEIAIRVPALHVDSPARGTAFGVASAIVFTAIGAIILPRLRRRTLATIVTD